MRGKDAGNYNAMKGWLEELESETVLTYPLMFVQMLDGDNNTALILKELVYWSDKGGRKDGRFYKSIPDLSAETGLTVRMIRRCIKVLEDLELIDRKVLRAQGAPTNHFYLHMDKLEELMRSFAEMPNCDNDILRKSQKGRSKVTKGQIRNLQKGRSESDKRADPEQPTTQPTTQPITTTCCAGNSFPGGDDLSGDRFEEFWELYPRQVDEKGALKAWHKINPDEALQERIIKSLREHVESEDWTKESGRYVPLATNWLDGERWKDRLKPPRTPKRDEVTERNYDRTTMDLLFGGGE